VFVTITNAMTGKMLMGWLQTVLMRDIQFPSALAVLEDTLYWAEKRKNAIFAASKFTGKDRHKVIKVEGHTVTSMAIMHSALQPACK
jgi:hypothetical protein